MLIFYILLGIAAFVIYRHSATSRQKCDNAILKAASLDSEIQDLKQTLTHLEKQFSKSGTVSTPGENAWTMAKAQAMEEKLSELTRYFNRLMDTLSLYHGVKDVRAPQKPSPFTEPHPTYADNSIPKEKDTNIRKSANFKIDWENFTGVKLFSWIGGFALFLGAIFFVKYSIDQGLISPLIRIMTGLVIGASGIVASLWLKKKGYSVTVHTLAASGSAILYADIFAANTLYHFINAGVAFSFMALVTVLAFLLSVKLNSRYVAILGMVGGFLTPPLVSTGVDRPFSLFSYIALLDIGLAAVALRKKWEFLLGMGAIGTLMTQIGWVQKFFEVAKVYTGLGIFLFFPLLFIGILLVAEKRKQENAWILYPAAILPLICMCFAGYLMTFSELAARPELLFSFLFILDLAVAGLAYHRKDLRYSHLVAGGAAFLLLLSWTTNYLTQTLLPWALFFYLIFSALHAAFPVALQRKHPYASPFVYGNLYPILMLIPVMVLVAKEITSPYLIWPAVLLIDLIAIGAAVGSCVFWIITPSLIATMICLGLAFSVDTKGFLGLLFVVAIFALFFFAVGLYAIRRQNQKKGADSSNTPETDKWWLSPKYISQIPALSAILPFLLLIMASAHLTLVNPTPVFGVGVLLITLLLGLVYFYKVEILSIVTLGSAVLLQYTWHLSRFDSAFPIIPLQWYVVYFSLFMLFPFIFYKRTKDIVLPWVSAAFAGPAVFYLIYKAATAAIGSAYIGLLPAIFAVIYLAGLYDIIKKIPSDVIYRKTLLALFGGVTLFFISLIFPLQFEKEWITLGWALEGMALVWLYRRIPHEGLKIWGSGLLAISFIRLTFNPAVLEYHARTSTPILNWYFYTYGIAALCLFGSAKLWLPQEEQFKQKRITPVLSALGVILVFLLLNIEIADFFSTGRTLTFQFSGSLAQDMTYTLGWALFGFVLFLVGINRSNRGSRMGGIGLLSVTVGKLFLHDLWRLGQLYRVAAFVGLAGLLILSSFLYQRKLQLNGKPEVKS